jgi:hypothetical protein
VSSKSQTEVFGTSSSRSADVAATGGGNETDCRTDPDSGDNPRFIASATRKKNKWLSTFLV